MKILEKLEKINGWMWILTLALIGVIILHKNDYQIIIIVLAYLWVGYWIGCENK